MKCVANAHAGPDERIIEFSDGSDGTGGLISFRRMVHGKLRVEVYRCENCEVVNESHTKRPVERAADDLLAALKDAATTLEFWAAEYGRLSSLKASSGYAKVRFAISKAEGGVL